MSHEHELDERLRQRVASLYEREASPALDVAARARALGEAWRVQRRARRRRAQLVALSCGVVAAAAGVLLVLRGAGWLQPSAAGKAAQPMAATAGCRLPSAPAWSVAVGGQRVLKLGELGRLVGDGKVVASSACELRVEVADGTLAGQLHALRPSRIVIATAGGSVIVTGTRFSVRAREDELRVVLAAGKVSVEQPGGVVQELSAGHVLSRRGRAEASTLPLSAAEASRLDQLLGVAKDDERAVFTAALAEESAWNQGAAEQDRALGRTDTSSRRTTDSARAPGDRGATRVGSSAAAGGEDGVRASRRAAAREGAPADDSAPAANGGATWRRPDAVVRSAASARVAARPLDDGHADVESARAPAPVRVPASAGEVANSRASEDASGASFTCDAQRDGATNSGELLAEGEQARKKGRLALARRCYAAAADGGNADAEVALLRWVRLELDHQALDRASALLARHAREYARPTLAAESAWLDVQVLAARGESDGARAAAEELIRAHATTPQARAAQAWLRQQ